MPSETVPPDLPGVEHRWVRTRQGITIHVADAGPADGPPVLLVHGFPQHWWEWRAQIGPLAADGFRVLVPDLRGAGWSDAPSHGYLKAEMAEDLADVLDELAVGPVTLAAHDWGGPAAFILLLERPDLVAHFLGVNTIAPWLTLDGPTLRHAPMFSYQLPMALPGLGPRVVGDRRQRYLRWLAGWVGGGYRWDDEDARVFLDRMRDPARARAGSLWYRTFQNREALAWMRGQYADRRVTIPVRFLTGLDDPVVTPTLHRGYADHVADIEFEQVPGVGHWIAEQAPDLVTDRIRALRRREPSA